MLQQQLIDYLKRYTRDFIVIDHPQRLGIEQFPVSIDDDTIVASYKLESGDIGIFWGSKTTTFPMHGYVCYLLTESDATSKGSDLLLRYKELPNGVLFPECATLVTYGSAYCH